MKKILTLGLCLALGSSLLLMSSCEKVGNPVDDAEAAVIVAGEVGQDTEIIDEVL